MRFTLVFLLATSLVPLTSAAQAKGSIPSDASSPNNVSSALRVTASVEVPLIGAIAVNARCDDEGNIYFRMLDEESSKIQNPILHVPIRKITPDGKLLRVFTMPGPDLNTRDFFVTASGEVYVVAYAESTMGVSGVYVLEYSSDGSYKSKIPLDTESFHPRQLAVFKSGEFLLSGTHGDSGHTPFTAVFDGRGKLIRKIYEPEDEHARLRAEAGDRDFVPVGATWDNTAVVHGDVAAGSDGNVYLLRATSPALIYVISPKGEVIRKLRIDSPSSGLVAQHLKSSRGRLAISFLESHSTVGVISVTDYEGNPIATYVPDDISIYPGLPGCYDSRSFTFLQSGEENHIRLSKAEPK
jgi:hypothetical protein